ncbi:hypothetical protein JXI42_09545 [bacterium]|nr:hypothetical protein [bacterium]
MRTITKLSVSDSSTREMNIYIWYPADPVIGYWVEEVKAYWNARPVLGDTARPVLVFSHGGCGTSLWRVRRCQWRSHKLHGRHSRGGMPNHAHVGYLRFQGE